LGVTGDSGDVLVKGNSTILLAANGAADSSAARIAEGGDLAGEGGSEGVGCLLAGGGCNLDEGVCDSISDQREEEVPTVDICESPGCMPGHVGWVWHSSG
jgi:hypothetical protein